MKKVIKRSFLFIIVVLSLVLFFPSNTYASTDKTSYNGSYKYYEYVIKNYDVDIVVNENNTFDITETIDAYFKFPKHGIYRTIPLSNTITRLDGSTDTNYTQIKNVSVDNEYTTSVREGNYTIMIGSASSILTGNQRYVIKYTYNLGKDFGKDYDELYYNIIGTEWDTDIENTTFSITMPKEFDSSKLGFSSGYKGSLENSNVKYSVSGNKITGSYNAILREGEALTVRCELPEGYFVGAKLDVSTINYISCIIPIIFLIISILIWYKFGRDNKVVETVEFYPPEGFNSLEVGFLYNGRAENKDVISLLIYLANKGYIKISEIEKSNLFSKSKSFKITKLKEYDGNNINEKIFLDGLFTKKQPSATLVSLLANSDNHTKDDNVNEVTKSDLQDNFYRTIDKILFKINNKENKNKIFEKSASKKTIFIILMIIITYCLMIVPAFLNFGRVDELIVGLPIAEIGLSLIFIMLIGGIPGVIIKGGHSSLITRLAWIVIGLTYGVPIFIFIIPILQQNYIFLIEYLSGLICVFGMIVCLKYLPKRTPYGNEMLGKLRGFKNFLKTAEKEKLEALVMQNPTYFYDILPYTYVLGVSDKWIEKFESISIQSPSWYDSSMAFSMATFGSFMSNTMSSAQSSMSSRPSSSSSSGGGSSGGGSGGGGGGSW